LPATVWPGIGFSAFQEPDGLISSVDNGLPQVARKT